MTPNLQLNKFYKKTNIEPVIKDIHFSYLCKKPQQSMNFKGLQQSCRLKKLMTLASRLDTTC